MTFVVKNKEKLKLIRFEEGKTIKDEIPSKSKQKECTSTARYLQYSTSYDTHLDLPTVAFDGSRMNQESPP